MTRFQRAGHWRIGVNGTRHWVSEHTVDRDGWGGWPYGVEHAAPSTQRYVPDGTGTRQSNCPVCGEPVFFYWNENGSRVYFDALGPPWPKHPCMDEGVTSLGPRASEPLGRYELLVANARERVEALTPPPRLPGVFVVTGTVKVGPRRHVKLVEVGGVEQIVVLSPPAPPLFALAVFRETWLYWTEPTLGEHGKSPVWGIAQAAVVAGSVE